MVRPVCFPGRRPYVATDPTRANLDRASNATSGDRATDERHRCTDLEPIDDDVETDLKAVGSELPR